MFAGVCSPVSGYIVCYQPRSPPLPQLEEHRLEMSHQCSCPEGQCPVSVATVQLRAAQPLPLALPLLEVQRWQSDFSSSFLNSFIMAGCNVGPCTGEGKVWGIQGEDSSRELLNVPAYPEKQGEEGMTAFSGHITVTPSDCFALDTHQIFPGNLNNNFM